MALAPQEVLERLAGDPDRFPAALLMTGPSEPELERESRRLAARLLCPGEDPEGGCSSCRRVDAGLHPDFLTIDPEGVQIRVDRIREALAFGAGRPYESARRVARIARADLLGNEASNALLKSLEEPGAMFRWILTTTRPNALLTTILSRSTPVTLPVASFAERRRRWQSRDFSETDAQELVLFAGEEEPEPAARLAEGRLLRQGVIAALEDGLIAGHLVALVLLAEQLAMRDRGDARLLAELLADAAIASETPSAEAIRHHAVAGKLAGLGRHTGVAALRDAAVAAADPPPDNRRGNRRMHYEKVLLDLYAASRRRES
ncbi:MAG TPA: hypothetical protein VGL03_09900 [Thermoanaerobaculia bacterium]